MLLYWDRGWDMRLYRRHRGPAKCGRRNRLGWGPAPWSPTSCRRGLSSSARPVLLSGLTPCLSVPHTPCSACHAAAHAGWDPFSPLATPLPRPPHPSNLRSSSTSAESLCNRKVSAAGRVSGLSRHPIPSLTLDACILHLILNLEFFNCFILFCFVLFL